MPRRNPFLWNHYYHVYNRGFEKQTLFFNRKDFERFLYYVAEQKENYKETIGLISYSILPNHFHFVILNKKEGFDLSRFIGKICSSYAKYLQAKYGIQRNVFTSRFKAKDIHDELYLQQCVQYVEHNALKHGLVERSENWIFTSYDKEKPKDTPGQELLDLDWEFS